MKYRVGRNDQLENSFCDFWNECFAFLNHYSAVFIYVQYLRTCFWFVILWFATELICLFKNKFADNFSSFLQGIVRSCNVKIVSDALHWLHTVVCDVNHIEIHKKRKQYIPNHVHCIFQEHFIFDLSMQIFVSLSWLNFQKTILYRGSEFQNSKNFFFFVHKMQFVIRKRKSWPVWQCVL